MTISLKQMFLSLQTQLLAELGANRAILDHPGAQGEASELDWINMLSNHLPRRYRVTKAFVVDADENRSDQIDIVIHDRQYTPLLFNRSGQLYVPAESVYAVLEVKPNLNRAYVTYAGQKAASVRRLRRTTAPIPYAAGTYRPRPLFPILAGIVCAASSWNPPCGDPLKTALQDLAPDERLNLGCALKHSSFLARYDEPQVDLVASDPSIALVFFFLNLLQQLQSLGTVPAMDIAQYARVLADDWEHI